MWLISMAVSSYLLLPLSTFLLNVANLLMLALYIAQMRAKQLLKHPLFWPIIILLSGFTISISYSSASSKEALIILAKYYKLLLILPLGFILNTPKWRLYALYAFLTGIVITIIAIGLASVKILHKPVNYTPGAFFVNHIYTSLFLAFSSFILLQLMKSLKRYRFYIFPLLIINLGVLFLVSHGRSGQIVGLVLIIYFLLTNCQKKTIALFALMLPLIVLTLHHNSSVFRYRWTKQLQASHQDAGISERVEFLQHSLQLVTKAPWFGSGVGSFAKEYYALTHKNNTNPHNEYLHILVQLGAVGLILYAYLLFSIWRLSRLLPNLEQSIAKAAVITLLIGGAANSWLMDFHSGYLLVLMWGLSFAAYPYAPNKPKVSVIVTTYNWPQALHKVIKALLQQNYHNLEIIIADDGSTLETANLLQQFVASHIPIIHIWQEDNGFQAARIRNKAAQAASGEYLVFIDGDCLVLPDFIERHVALATPGAFVAGNRVLLSENFTAQLLSTDLNLNTYSLWQWVKIWLNGGCNRLAPLLTIPGLPWRVLSPRWQGAKGCNLALWRHDLYLVNGWESAFKGWGYEDSDLVARLLNAGLNRIDGRYYLPVIHLWHQEYSRAHAMSNWQLFNKRNREKYILANEGINES